MKLTKDLREFVELLNSAKIRYLVVGGHAVALHGYPRFTGDTDFFVESSPANAKALEQVLREFGFAGIGVTAQDFLQPGIVVQLGRPPSRIDLLTSIDGVSFEDAWSSRIVVNIDGMPMNFIGKDLLLKNKRASGRPQDHADADRLEGS
jgi:hypothetical protein